MPKAFMMSSKKRIEQRKAAETAIKQEQKKIDALVAKVHRSSNPITVGKKVDNWKRLRSFPETVVEPLYRSLITFDGLSNATAKKRENVYTGTEIIGLGQLHKSNLVPIRGKKQAEEVANMRRG